MKTKILDCTIRDGGYYTNWDFTDNVVDNYIEAFNSLPVDYLEVGYRSVPLNGYLGKYFYTPKYILEKIKSNSNKKIAIIIDEKNNGVKDVDTLLSPCEGLVDLVRIAINPINVKRAMIFAEEIKKKGFKVAFNVMYMSKWKQVPNFFENLVGIGDIVDFLYMVDSYGGVFPDDVKETIELVRKRTNVSLGFHGHNNLELALINTLTAIENNVDIVDSTITGMGRGAGNLKTELLLTVLKNKWDIELDFNSLSRTVSDFEKLQEKMGWGTNLPYMVSGANSLPQKEVMEWVTKRTYSLNSIIRALENQYKGAKDNLKLPILKEEHKYNKAIIIGGGSNAIEHKDAVRKYLSNSDEICIIHASSKNAAYYSDLEFEQYFCLVGNEGYRMENVLRGNFGKNVTCILPPYPRKMGTYIPKQALDKSREISEVTWISEINDSLTVLALESARLLGVKEILLIGYDGYEAQTMTALEKQLTLENEHIFSFFKEKFPEISMKSMLPTQYKSVDMDSIYKYV